MAVFTKEMCQKKLNTWLAAEEAIATGQSYQIGSRMLTRADLKQVREEMEYWAGKLAEAEAEDKHGGRNRAYRAVARSRRMRRERMEKPNILDRAIMAVAPVHAAKRAAARAALSVINSGYGNYGANLTKKSMRGWMYHGGSAKEDIEDNIDILQQRSRDAYMGIPTATAALKTMRTNVVAGGLMPAPQLDSDYLGLDEAAAEKLQAQIVREFALWADTPVCDAERMDNFYQLQQLAFLSYLMNGDTIALLPMKHQAGAPYDLRVRLIEADRVCSPDGFDRLMPCTVQGYEVQSIVQGVETDADGSGRHGDGILDMQPASAGQQQRRGRGGADVAKSGSLRRYNRAAERAAHHEPRAHRPAAGRSPAGPCAGEPETAWTLHGRGDHGGGDQRHVHGVREVTKPVGRQTVWRNDTGGGADRQRRPEQHRAGAGGHR